MEMQRDPDHPIIERLWEYRIERFCYENCQDYDQSFIDLTLRKGACVKRLRFLSPRDLKIEEGFPGQTGGMEILDVRHRQLEGIGVRVGDFEAMMGAVTFWAAEVIDLDEVDGQPLAG